MKLDEKALSALQIVSRLCAEGGHRFVLIGATVPQLLLDPAEERRPPGRLTKDIDAMVEAASWSAFEGILERLQEKGFQPSRTPHRLTFAGEVSLDLLPYGADIIEGNQLTWRDTEQVMSAVGFEETFQNAATVEIAPGLSVLVAAIPSLVLLKIGAYTDRPQERARDLLDMLYCFEHYAAEQDRRFDLAGRLVDGKELTYEECGAYLLGRDVVYVATRESLVRAREFVGIFDSEYSTPIGQILREEKRLAESGRRTSLFRLFRVFGQAVIS